MQLKTILNRVEPFKSFVYKHAEWDENANRLTIRVFLDHRKNGRPVGSGCRKVCPGYDRLPERTWEFVPLWQIAVLFVYAARRVNCPECGVVVERLPWGDGKCRQTLAFRWFLSRWAKRLSWKEVAEVFHTSWDTVYRSVRYAVLCGLVHRQLTSGLKDVVAIGVDEIQWQRGHHYLTLVYQIDAEVRRLLWVGRERTESTLTGFFAVAGKDMPQLQYVCSDMWKPYLNVIKSYLPNAVHVLDRYHVMTRMNKAIDEIRAGEARRLKSDGYEPVLKHSRWCLLKRRDNLTRRQTLKLRELLEYNLKAVRAYLLREDFQRFWTTGAHARCEANSIR